MQQQSPFRDLVVGVNTKVPLSNGQRVMGINFDNGATTPPFCSVIEEITSFAPWYSSIHRGAGYKSRLSSDIYEEGREMIKNFVNADKTRDIVIYTKNTTEAINLLSYTLAQNNSPKKTILATTMEHLANDLPWREQFAIDYVTIDVNGMLDINDLEMKLRNYRGKIALVAVTGASNVTGYKNPIHIIARLAHHYGAKILVDGAQLVPHCPIDMKPYDSSEHIDYLVFSAHKMYAPFGAGVLIGPKETFLGQEPFCKGGGAVTLVSHQFVHWDAPPHKEEAGTPNVIGVVALLTAIKTLTSLGMHTIDDYEQQLIRYTIKGLAAIDGIKIYSSTHKPENRLGIVSFDLPGIHHETVAKIFAYESGISVRSGLFCAHPYVETLLGLTPSKLEDYQQNPKRPFPGLVRISFGLYNNCQEVDLFLAALKEIMNNKNFYQKRYEETT